MKKTKNNKNLNLVVSNLIELTKEDLIGLCYLKGFESEELTELNLQDNKLINIDFIQSNMPFINLKYLYIARNKITDINNIKYLVNLELLDISDLKLDDEKETLKILKTIKTIKILWCFKTFNDYTLKELKKELPNIKIN